MQSEKTTTATKNAVRKAEITASVGTSSSLRTASRGKNKNSHQIFDLERIYPVE